MALEFVVGGVTVQALQEHEGCPFAIFVAEDGSPIFDFQSKNRALSVSYKEFTQLLDAMTALKEMYEDDERQAFHWFKVHKLTRDAVLRAARTFHGIRKTAKWTTVVEGVELPARPLILEAAGVPPNDPTNSHQAVAKLKALGFEVRYEGRTV